MARLSFTANLKRHIDAGSTEVVGSTVRAALDSYFAEHPEARGYVLDDQGMPRAHVAIFLNDVLVRDREGLSDPVGDGDEIFVMQALSGG